MAILILGGGGREHALAWRLARDAGAPELIAAPGSDAIAAHARRAPDLDILDARAVARFALREGVDLVVVGPEAPLAAGVADALAAAGVPCFGPTAAAARLETSKACAKEIADAVGAPTARWAEFDAPAPAKAYLRAEGAPIVVKADGLAAGKGVTVATTLAEAEAAVDAIFAGAFGAGTSVVIEEVLQGEEASLFALVDGAEVALLPPAQDHKRAFDGDAGPNTGGMGAYVPAPVAGPETIARAEAEIIRPIVAEMARRGAPYRGVLYAGLMIAEDGAPSLIEINARFGDPEAQVLMTLLESDLAPALRAAATGRLREAPPLRFAADAAMAVVLAAKGYPGAYAKGEPIRGLEAAAAAPGVTVFEAGARRGADGATVSNGGRVLNVCARGPSLAEARARAYAAVDMIDWPGGFHRRDIGWRAL